MVIKAVVKANTYADSMVLMALSTKVNELPMVHKAMVGMGTSLNKQVIKEVGLATPEIEGATARDQIIVVECESEELCEAALEQVEELRNAGPISDNTTSYATLHAAINADPDASLVVISIPGQYAYEEAQKALTLGKNVMIFSDNVTVEEEKALKLYAHENGLLVMGPDCGTAIINGIGLCFANNVAAGKIGVVAASGTGSQEISVQIDHLGSGISQLVGVGGRDLSAEIGGIMMLDALEMLDQDPATEVIVLLSKPPAKEVAETVLAATEKVSKPVVVCFIGADRPANLPEKVEFVSNTLQAAQLAVKLAAGEDSGNNNLPKPRKYFEQAQKQSLKASLNSADAAIVGLFCGGTVCDEVFHALNAKLPSVGSNVAKKAESQLANGVFKHQLIDLGDDQYTQGRAHPMIDPTLRKSEIEKVAANPDVSVLLLDFEIGYGSHQDPVGATIENIQKARETAEKAGRTLTVIAYVLGTDKDPQNKAQQRQLLEDNGVVVVDAALDLASAALEIIEK